MGGSTWTEAERQQVKIFRAQGWSFTKIGKAMGRSKNSIAGIIERNRPAYRVPPKLLPHNFHRSIPVSIPEFVLDARAKRSEERALMTEAQLLMGDPPPSQSATAQAQGASSVLPIPDSYDGAPTL